MWFLLAVGSALIFGAAGLLMKASQAAGGNTSHLLFGLYLAGTVGFGLNSLLTPPDDWLSGSLLLAGLIVGAGSAWGNLVWMKALAFGPAGLTSLLTNLNIVVVVLLAVVWYGESLGLLQFIGICLLFGAISLVTVRPGESWTIREKTWFALILLAILLFTFRNGGLKVTGEMALPGAAVLFVGYLFSLIWFGAAMIRERRRNTPKKHNKKADRHELIGLRYGLLAGSCSYGGLQLYALALERGPANLIAPIFAANSLVIALGAMFFFQERLNTLQKWAVLCLLVGLMLVRA